MPKLMSCNPQAEDGRTSATRCAKDRRRGWTTGPALDLSCHRLGASVRAAVKGKTEQARGFALMEAEERP